MMLAEGGKNRIKLTRIATIEKCTAVDKPPVTLKRNTSGAMLLILLANSKDFALYLINLPYEDNRH